MREVEEWPGLHCRLQGRRRGPCRRPQMGGDGEDRHRHHSAAVFAAPRRSLLGLGRDEAQHPMQQPDEPFAVGMEKAVVATAPQALGQDVTQQQPQEVRPGQGAGFLGAGVVGIAEGHLTVRVAQDVLLRQHPAIEIAAKVDQRLVPVADWLAVDHPLGRQVGPDGPAEFLHRGEPLGPEDLSQGLVGEEELARLAIPVAGGGVDGPSGQHHMHMGMEVEGAVVGVQHHGGAQVPMQGLVAQPERGEGLPGEADEEIIGLALMVVDQRTQGRGQGEGDQVVVDRQELGALPFEPSLAGLVLALGAEAVAAGQREDRVAVAVLAVDGGGAQCLGAALLDRRQGLAVAGQQPAAVLLLQIREEGLDHLGKGDHAASRQRRTKDSSRRPWRSRAWAAVTSVRCA